MKKISHIFKIVTSILLKIIIAILMGLGSSFGKDPMVVEKKGQTIGKNK